MTQWDGGRQELPPPADLEGHSFKPDPLAARTPAELKDLMRLYWKWSGKPSCQHIADHSGGAFSKGTVRKLLYDEADTVPLKLNYLRGCICGCGGDPDEQKRWVTAWRKIHLQPPAGNNPSPGGEGDPHG